MFWPDPEINWSVPVSVASEPLTSSTSVVTPAPSPNRGTETASEPDVPATGSAVSMNSPRSLNRVLNVNADTGRLDVNVKVRAALIGFEKRLEEKNGVWSRNAATCEFAGIVMLDWPKLLPSSSVKSRELVAASLVVFAWPSAVFSTAAASTDTAAALMGVDAGNPDSFRRALF